MKEYPKTITYRDPDGVEKSVIVISSREEKLFKPPSTEREILDEIYANREINRIKHMDEKTKKKAENNDAYLLELRISDNDDQRKRIIKKYKQRQAKKKIKGVFKRINKITNWLMANIFPWIILLVFGIIGYIIVSVLGVFVIKLFGLDF